MSQYSFPILKNSEVLLCCNELSIELVEDDLVNPKSVKVQKVYNQLNELLLNEGREDMNQPAFAGMIELEYPELHDESIAVMAYVKACSKLLTTCGINDFTLDDLTKPDYKRFRRNISAVINFAKFREERATHYMQFSGRTDELTEQKLALEEENEVGAEGAALGHPRPTPPHPHHQRPAHAVPHCLSTRPRLPPLPSRPTAHASRSACSPRSRRRSASGRWRRRRRRG